ncbi:hypothetical protein RJ639_003737 [Escallonia herrerae]|uniref:Interferon-related developmental regulator N-terminal domain-containing protein n=1 Tax=Escallonia herrerae TaxID=1293975 RepID=A0AA88W343_9ASTE|nr:hypothetical protein RJ639_003737 [Escallonia herrerae]
MRVGAREDKGLTLHEFNINVHKIRSVETETDCSASHRSMKPAGHAEFQAFRGESPSLLNKLAADLSIYTNLNPCSLPDSSGVQFISPDAVVSASSSLHSCLPEAEIFVGFWGTTRDIFDCLAIVTFVGGSTVEETERSMQIVWDFIYSGTGSSAVAKKHSAAVQIAAISAWSLLLTTVDEWSLKADDGSLHIVACEALALIFEMGCLEKFASGTDGTDASSIHEGNVFPNRFSSIQELREKLLVRARALSLLAKVESSTTLSVKGKHNTEWDVLIILEENQLLHDVFDFTPKAKLSGDELYVSEREERIYRSPNSVFRKARTQILNRQRAIRVFLFPLTSPSLVNPPYFPSLFSLSSLSLSTHLDVYSQIPRWRRHDSLPAYALLVLCEYLPSSRTVNVLSNVLVTVGSFKVPQLLLIETTLAVVISGSIA